MEEKIVDRKEAKEAGILCKEFIFKVSYDDLYVYLDNPPINEEEKTKFRQSWEEIKTCLKIQGIQLVLEAPEALEGKIIVAKAHPPKEGYPEKIELLPKFLKLIQPMEEKSEESKKEERKDLREEFSKIICAEANEPIAKWFPSLPPTPGINVWGDVIEPPPLKEEKTFELGELVYLDEKDNLIKAKTAGVVTFSKGRLEVLPEYTHKGDVDFSVGNIHFKGRKLVIQGDIKYGFKVECQGAFELKGGTENKVLIQVEGPFLCDGIIRGEDTLVKVMGEARIKGAEFAKIEVEGNLYVKDYLVFTQTSVSGEIFSTEGKGLIYGGKVSASGNIEVKILGHPAQTKSEVFAGYLPETVEGYLKILEAEEIYLETLKKIHSGIELAEKFKKEGRLGAKQEEILQKLLAEEIKIKEKLKEIKEKLKTFKGTLSSLRSKTIKVLQKVYPNVIIQIADITYTVGSEISGPVTFYLEDVAIKTRGDK